MRISDWSSDVCSSDLGPAARDHPAARRGSGGSRRFRDQRGAEDRGSIWRRDAGGAARNRLPLRCRPGLGSLMDFRLSEDQLALQETARKFAQNELPALAETIEKSEEQTSELQSLMRTSYAVFCLKKKKRQKSSAEANPNTL